MFRKLLGGVKVGVKTKVSAHHTWTCDKCSKDMEVVVYDPPVSVDPPLPPEWASLTIKGLPTPAVHRMADTLDGDHRAHGDPRATSAIDVLRDWEDDDFPLETKRVLCDDCLINVWDAIGLPERPAKVTSYGDAGAGGVGIAGVILPAGGGGGLGAPGGVRYKTWYAQGGPGGYSKADAHYGAVNVVTGRNKP